MVGKIKQYLPLFIIICLSILGYYFNLHLYLSMEAIQKNHIWMENQVHSQYVVSLILYCFAYITVVSLSIPGASFMTLIGGILFGQIVGTVAVVISATIGASIIFSSAKMASKNFIKRQAGRWVQKMQSGFQENAFYYLLTIRLVPLFPFFAVNIVPAIFQVSLRDFILATFIGIIPGTFVFTSLGVALRDIIHRPDLSLDVVLEPSVIMALSGLAILSMLPVIYKSFKS